MTPQRIQRQRTKGYRLPVGAIYVGRPTRWGNPFRVGALFRTPGFWRAPCPDPIWQTHENCLGEYTGLAITNEEYTYEVRRVADRAHAVELFASYARFHDDVWDAEALKPLAGRDLACWCPLDQPCHADVLLRIANPERAS